MKLQSSEVRDKPQPNFRKYLQKSRIKKNQSHFEPYTFDGMKCLFNEKKKILNMARKTT
jgi:hypothetical protein